MCGRTACTLNPDEVCKASTIRISNSDETIYSKPQWKDHPGCYSYSPCTNISPTCFTPILFREYDHSIKRDLEGAPKPKSAKYVVQPMMWGLVPHFYKGDCPKKHGYQTNNCRLEGIKEKKLFKPSLQKGQRCVVLCEGFYEWLTTKGSKNKQPFFVCAPQGDTKIWERSTWENLDDLWTERDGWKGPQLLKLAGIYSVWKSSDGNDVYSYSVITMEAGEEFSWLHHRIPAILSNDDEVEKWLNSGCVEVDSALAILNPSKAFQTHKVSTRVNNSRNQESTLMEPCLNEEKTQKPSASSNFMANWLKKSV